MAPTTCITRRLHRLAVVGLNASNSNGGTESYVSLNTTLGQFDATAQLAEQYEQYRITNLKIEVRPNCQNVSGLTDAVDRIAACYALNNYSVAEMFIDYDSSVAPTQAEIYRRDKFKNYRINPDAWKTISNFKPRAKFNTNVNSLPALVAPNTEWLSTDFTDIPYLGVRGVFKQDSDFWGVSASDSARFSVYYSATVEFRGLKSGN